jgi:O-acetyl-ADP-ribose deacetylase (regulator of RNase III)
MFGEYRRACQEGLLKPGHILPYRKEVPWILNFAVKDDWRRPSRIEWVENCLSKFVDNYRRMGITSVAMPWIGAMNGRLPWNDVHALMRSHLETLNDIDIEVVEFAPEAPDPLFRQLQAIAALLTPLELAQRVSISERAASIISAGISGGSITSLAGICELESLGERSIDRLYAFLLECRTRDSIQGQNPLF